MDCPMEEALIRKKLATVPGITGLEFNLMQRVLTVHHELPSTDAIEAALKAIDMTPEPLSALRGAEAVFSVNGMDCPDEERLIRSKLDGMPGVYALDFNLMQRVLKVRHEPSALPAISAALASLNMDARLLDAQPENTDAIPAPKIPWKKLAVAGIFAALSECAELIHEWGAKPFGIDMASWSWGGYPVLEFLPLLFAVIAIALGGLTTYKKGWLAVSNRNLNINALMSVAVTGAVLIGQFPEAAMVMVLFNVSEAIEAKALDRARNAIKDLLALAPDTATVLRADGSWQDMDIREVPVGSRVRVKPVSLAEAVGDVKAAFDAKASQRIHHDRRRADAIRIIVAADHHLFLARLGSTDTHGDFFHALCGEGITEDGRLKQCVQIFLRKIMCCQHSGAQPAQLMTPHELLFAHGIDFGNLHSFLLITQRRQFPACVLG